MATKTLLSLVGGHGSYKLAPNADWPKDKLDGVFVMVSVTGIDASAALTEVLNLSGSFAIHMLDLGTLAVNDVAQIKLTVDGVVIWDVDPLTNSGTEKYIGALTPGGNEFIVCDSSFVLEVKMDTDSDIKIQYLVRPIL